VTLDPRTIGEQFGDATDRLLPALDALAERHGLHLRDALHQLGANPYVRSDMDPHLTALVHRVALAIIAEALAAEDRPTHSLRSDDSL
jgi:hypothetical protein